MYTYTWNSRDAFLYTIGTESRLILTSNPDRGCTCPGEILTYECTVEGAGATVWKGSAFNCRSANDGITLLHSRFDLSGGTDGECNNGAIVGRSLRVEDNYYTSLLSVTITPDMTGRSITCIHDNGT